MTAYSKEPTSGLLRMGNWPDRPTVASLFAMGVVKMDTLLEELLTVARRSKALEWLVES